MAYQCLCEIINNIIPVSKTMTPGSKCFVVAFMDQERLKDEIKNCIN